MIQLPVLVTDIFNLKLIICSFNYIYQICK